MTELSILAAYLLLLLCLGLFANRLFRGTTRDYMLASHSIGPLLLLLSLFGTTMTAFALIGSTGESFKEGMGVYGQLASSSGIVHSLCFFLVGVKLWSIGRRHGYTTQIQFFRDRLQSDRIGLLLFPILVGMVIPYLLIGVIGAGAVISSVSVGAFDTAFEKYDYAVPPWLGSLVICFVVLAYVFFGGMRGTAWANAFQTSVFMGLGVVTFFVISGKLGEVQRHHQRQRGEEVTPAGILQDLRLSSRAVMQREPSKLMREVDPRQLRMYQRNQEVWEVLAYYNYATEELGLQLTEERIERAEARFEYRMTGWRQRAAARYAYDEGLIELDERQRQLARLIQDDRRIPDDPEELFDAGGHPRPLGDFERDGRWQKRAEEMFADKIGHPRQLLVPDDPSQGYRWTRNRALGEYRVARWAPEAPRSMSHLKFFTYMLIPLSVGMFPHVFQHWLTARSAASFKLPIVMHPIFILIVWAPCVLVGVWATAAVTEAGHDLIPPHFPANQVLAKMVSDLSTPILAGLLSAGVLAAIMSSLDSQFLSLGTIFTNDICLHYSKQERFSERQKVILARCFIVAIVALTYFLSLYPQRRVFTLGVWCFSGFSSLFPLVVAAIYWRRLTKAGAYACVGAAFVAWCLLFRASDYGMNSGYTFLGAMPVATMIVCSTLALVGVSLLTRPPDKNTLAKFFDE